jgi:hypothetical protein
LAREDAKMNARTALAVLFALFSLALPNVAAAQPHRAHTLFQDEFTGRTTKPAWEGLTCPWANKQSTGICDDDAAYLDGRGHLILPANPDVGAVVATFDFDAGFPTPRPAIRASWHVPFTIALRAKVPATAGYTGVGWMERVDSWADNAELDFAEETTSRANTAQAFHHMWHSTTPCPADARCFDDGHWLLGDERTDVGRVAGAWHTYGMRVTDRHVTYMVDGKTIQVAPGVYGWYGLLLQNIAGIQGSWIAGYPDPDLAPWPAPDHADSAVIDSVIVTRP